MQDNHGSPGPLVIGGVGGSGTRVIAEIISIFGFYIGYDLNPASDNLWFTLLFKRTKWYRKAYHHRDKVFTGLRLLSKAMVHRDYPSLSEVMFALQAVVEMVFSGYNYKGAGRGLWPLVRVRKMITKRPKMLPNYIGWGWKEPNTHIYINSLSEYFEGFRYIHTIRHGLDMAFSKNQQQLFDWGTLFGVDLPKNQSDVPRASLKFWIQANQRVYKIAEELGGKKILVINFDNLCLSPESEIQQIISFLNIKPDANSLEQAINIPKIPKSLGRYRDHDLTQFDAVDLDVLKAFGFSINTHDY